jgi:hypothetical protein
MRGEETRVELLAMDPATTALLRAHRLNLGERFQKRTNGTTLLTMRVRGIEELANWVLRYGAHVRSCGRRRGGSGWARDLRAASALYSEA